MEPFYTVVDDANSYHMNFCRTIIEYLVMYCLYGMAGALKNWGTPTMVPQEELEKQNRREPNSTATTGSRPFKHNWS